MFFCGFVFLHKKQKIQLSKSCQSRYNESAKYFIVSYKIERGLHMKRTVAFLLCAILLLCAGMLPATYAQEAADTTPFSAATLTFGEQGFAMALQTAVLQKAADNTAGTKAARTTVQWNSEACGAPGCGLSAQHRMVSFCSTAPKGDVLQRFTQMTQPLHGDAFWHIAKAVTAIWAA